MIYTNMGHEMATVIFSDGGGIILGRGERKTDKRTAKWIDRSIRVTAVPQQKPKPVKPVVESNSVKTEDTK